MLRVVVIALEDNSTWKKTIRSISLLNNMYSSQTVSQGIFRPAIKEYNKIETVL